MMWSHQQKIKEEVDVSDGDLRYRNINTVKDQELNFDSIVERYTGGITVSLQEFQYMNKMLDQK